MSETTPTAVAPTRPLSPRSRDVARSLRLSDARAPTLARGCPRTGPVLLGPAVTARRAFATGSACALVAFLVCLQQVMSNGALVDFDRRFAERVAHHRLVEVLIGWQPVQGRFVSLAETITVLGE